jgi:hypothetical protein
VHVSNGTDERDGSVPCNGHVASDAASTANEHANTNNTAHVIVERLRCGEKGERVKGGGDFWMNGCVCVRKKKKKKKKKKKSKRKKKNHNDK